MKAKLLLVALFFSSFFYGQTISIPDANFEQALIDLGYDTNGLNGNILQAEALTVTNLDVSYKNISSLVGIEGFTNLTSLKIFGNNVNNLNVTNLTQLEYLDIGQNQINTIDLSQNSNLISLKIKTNNISALNVNNLTQLEYLDISQTQINSIDLSQNLNLKFFEGSRWLTSISFANNSIMEGIGLAFMQSITTFDFSLYPSLKYANLSGCPISSVDLSNNPNLEILYLNNNSNLSSLDVSNNPNLRELEFAQTNVSSIDLSNNLQLETLFNYGCRFTTFICPNLPNLKYLIIRDQQVGYKLSTIDISNAPVLEVIDLDSNDISVIDISNNNALINFKANFNKIVNFSVLNHYNLTQLSLNDQQIGYKLSSLDVSGAPALQQVRALNNELSNLDLSNNNQLLLTFLDNNNLNTLNLQNGNNNAINYFSVLNNPNLTCIQVDDVTIANSKVVNNEWAVDAQIGFSTDCGNPNNTYFLDIEFEQALIDLGIDTDGLNGYTPTAQLNTVTSLDVSNMNISNLSGISSFVNLTYLNVGENNLTSIDVSALTQLETLIIQNNQITSIDLSNNTNLIEFYADNNLITGGNIQFRTTSNSIFQNNTSVEIISLENNPLGSIDLNGLTSLEYLYLTNTGLSNIDLSTNIALLNTNINQNSLSTIDVSNNVNLFGLNINQNAISTLDVSNNTLLQSLYFEQNNVSSIDISTNTNLINLWARYNRITTVNALNHLNLTQLILNDQQAGYKLTSLDVTGAPALTYLWFSGNEVSTIDLSNNNLVTSLDAKVNQITGDIDLSNMTNLNFVAIRNNLISALNLANGNNINLSTISIGNNPNLTCVQVDDVTYADTQVTNGVWYKDAGTSFSADCFTILSNEDFNSTEFKIYPNPVQSILHIDNALDLNKVEIYSITGKKVKSITNNLSEIDVNDLESGIYFVKLFTNKGITTQKIIKE